MVASSECIVAAGWFLYPCLEVINNKLKPLPSWPFKNYQTQLIQPPSPGDYVSVSQHGGSGTPRGTRPQLRFRYASPSCILGPKETPTCESCASVPEIRGGKGPGKAAWSLSPRPASRCRGRPSQGPTCHSHTRHRSLSFFLGSWPS